MEINFVSKGEAFADVLERRKLLVKAFNRVSCKIDDEIIRTNQLLIATERASQMAKEDPSVHLNVRRMEERLRDLKGTFIYLNNQRFGLMASFSRIEGYNAPIRATLHCGFEQEVQDLFHKAIEEAKRTSVSFEKGDAIDIVVDGYCAHRFFYRKSAVELADCFESEFIEPGEFDLKTEAWAEEYLP